MSPFSPHLDILPPAQRALWPSLRDVTELGFVLYGGTAIALRLAHRQSIDFDFFTANSFAPSELRERLPVLGASELRHSTPNSLTIAVTPAGHATSVALSFFGGLTIGRVGEPERSDDGVIVAASLDDLMATKLKVLHDRVEARDYIDIAAMIRHGVSLARGLASGLALYGGAFDPMIALRAVTWFDDGDLTALSDSDRTVLRTAAAPIHAPLPDIQRRDNRLSNDA